MFRRSFNAFKAYRTRFFSKSAIVKPFKPNSGKNIVIVTPPIILGIWCLSNEHPASAASIIVHFPLRLGRDIGCASSVVADYWISLRDLNGEDYILEQKKCHERSAKKLSELCFRNGGIYIKLGQVASQLDHLLPEEYTTHFKKTLLDKCPIATWEEIQLTVIEELGRPISELFSEFDSTPIASASLAQVHRCVGLDGQEYAVKIQHLGLRETFQADIMTVNLITRVVHKIFPDFDYSWLVKEMNETLPKELNFLREVENAERCRANFSSSLSRVGAYVHIPSFNMKLCTEKLLTMEFIRGAKLSEPESLKARGIKPQMVASLVARAFSEMIFLFGDIHCDPHAANLIVRNYGGKIQIVLLDHGLYKRISDDLRLAYAALWQSLIFGDAEGIKTHCQSMNVGDLYPLFAGMITSRPWEEITKKNIDHLHVPLSPDKKRLLQSHAKEYSRE